MSYVDPNKPVQRVAIVRALPGLGDLLCVIPAWRALRAALPHAQITLIGLPSMRWIAARFPHYIDEVVALPGFPGLPEQPPAVDQLPAFFAAMQARQFDLAIQMHGSGTITNPLTMLLGAQATAGLYMPGHYRPDAERFLPSPAHEHEVRRNLQLSEHLGMLGQGEHSEWPVLDADRQVLHAIEVVRDLKPHRYVCVHAGASTPARRWSPEHFATVADALAAHGLQIVLTGVAAEADAVAAVARAMRAPSINLAGRTELGSLGALLGDARLVVCNDTGVSHLAAALAVPSVVIFLEDARRQWAPLDHGRHRSLYNPNGVPVDAVLRHAHGLLQHAPARGGAD